MDRLCNHEKDRGRIRAFQTSKGGKGMKKGKRKKIKVLKGKKVRWEAEEDMGQVESK